MDAVLHDDPSAIDALTPAWASLWDADPAATAFQRPEYASAHRHVFDGPRPAVIEIRRDGAAAGIAAVEVDAGVLRLVGDPEITDYLGPVSAAADRDAVAEGFCDAIARIDGWTSADLPCLASDGGWVEAIARAAKAAGLAVEERQHDVCPRVGLGGSFDDYLAATDAKLRHEIRRKARKLERDAAPATIRLTQPHEIDSDLERFYDMHRSSEGPKGRFLHWGMEAMFKLLARRLAALGWLRFVWMEVGGEPWAAIFGWSARGVWSIYNSAYDHRRRDLSPGMVLTAETLRLAAEEGCATFDFLRGPEPYKYRFGAVDVPLQRLTLRRA